jgi:hypothetical protein
MLSCEEKLSSKLIIWGDVITSDYNITLFIIAGYVAYSTQLFTSILYIYIPPVSGLFIMSGTQDTGRPIPLG